MKKFAELLNTLYFTYSHLDKIILINQYFLTTPDPERGYALGIMVNALRFPTIKKNILKELIQENVDPVLFDLSYDYVGDLSETIALLWTFKNSSELPFLSEIINHFKTLPPEKLKPYLAKLLNASNAYERWALIKLVTGNLRIGVSQRFLKKCLAIYGKVNTQDIEKIWHSLQVPYIDLFAWLENRAPKPESSGHLFFHSVMLSHPLSEKDLLLLDLKQFSYERKYDGIRVQIVSTGKEKALFTRTGEDISHTFPDLLISITTAVILDGELIIKTDQGIGTFNQLQQRLNRKSPGPKLLKESPAAIILYDILSEENNDLCDLPFLERRTQLETWFYAHSAPNILLSELLFLEKNQTLPQLKEHILNENQPAVEGLMLKHQLSPYIAGRPKGYWYKWKRNPLIIDAVLMYAQRGHGKRSSYYSDYTFGLWKDDKLLPVGKAYSGFTDAELLILDKWIRHHTIKHFGPVREVVKKLVMEIAFDAVNFSNRHKSGVALRFPRINHIRWDKPVIEADHLNTLINLIGNKIEK